MMLDGAQHIIDSRPLYIRQVKSQRDFIGTGECFSIVQDMGESVLLRYEKQEKGIR
jgi:hypothetical protein